MKKNYNVIFILIIALLLSSCGYKIAGFSGNSIPVRYYVDNIYNNTFYTEFGDTVEDIIKKELIIYGELSSYRNATYFMDVRLENINFYSDINSPTDEAISTTIELELQFIITDVDGIEVFSYSSTTTESFGIRKEVQSSLEGRKKSLELATKTAMENYRYAFNSKFYD